MKSTLILLSLLFIVLQNIKSQNNSYHNKLDDIINAHQLKKLILSIDKDYKYLKINDSFYFQDKRMQHIVDSLHLKPFAKADFDNNGYTDIILVQEGSYETSIIVIMDTGNNKIYIKNLSTIRFGNLHLAFAYKQNQQTFLNLIGFKMSYWPKLDSPVTVESIKLIYKYGDFIENNNTPENHAISKIEYNTGACYGLCPIFSLIIDSSRNASYHAIKFNKEQGDFKTIINLKDYNKITELINYINFATLEDDYNLPITDQPTSWLTITYDNGKVKRIKDYGEEGTYGLMALYKLLFRIRSNQSWVKE
jgi:hypothetical protein